jgi:hypothetical protein
MNTKFKKGEKVIVKDDLVVGRRYASEKHAQINDSFSRLMSKNLGKEATIISVEYGRYRLDIDELHLYTDGMLMPIIEVEEEEEVDIATLPYVRNNEVERLILHMKRLVPQQLINDALDKGDKAKFLRLTKKNSKNLLTNDTK